MASSTNQNTFTSSERIKQINDIDKVCGLIAQDILTELSFIDLNG